MAPRSRFPPIGFRVGFRCPSCHLVVAIALCFGAHAQEPPQERPQPPAEATTAAGLERGIEVYRANACGACHRLERVGAGGFFGPPHDDVAAAAAARLRDPGYRGAARTVAEYLRESITDPTAYLVPEYALTRMAMPAYGHLSDVDLDALVQLLLTAGDETADDAPDGAPDGAGDEPGNEPGDGPADGSEDGSEDGAAEGAGSTPEVEEGE